MIIKITVYMSRLLVLLTFTSIIISSCSHQKSPVEPVIDLQAPISTTEISSERILLGVYDAEVDPESETFTITPVQRTVDYHYPLTQLYPNVLTITGYGFTPNFWADIKITHPLPNSGIDGFDPRVIAILPANPGVSMNYPVMNAVGNNSVVLNQDGYTKLYDSLGGSIPGNTNPFLAYFKHVEYRRWFSSGTGMTSDTRRWDMDIDGFGGPLEFQLVVDVSLNYPDQPQQIVDNASEPVEISAIIGEGLESDGGSTSIEVTLLDWQGPDEIECCVECPELFNGVILLSFEAPGPNPNEYRFSGTISNELLALADEYSVLISALDVQSNIQIFDEAIAEVYESIIFNPVDVTPTGLNFSPDDIFVEGDYAYTIGWAVGLNVFDISNPLDPFWVKSIETSQVVNDLYISNGYAYLATSPDDLQIIDIDPLDDAYIVNSVDIPGDAKGVDVSGDNAYVTSGSQLHLLSIEPPESAHVVSSFVTSSGSCDIQVSNSYAYVAVDYDRCFQIIDIEPPESGNIVKTIQTSFDAVDVQVSDGYAYVACSQGGLKIIDIEPPESAYIVKSVDTLDHARSVYVINDFAYVASQDAGLHIVDIETPESASILNSVDIPCWATGVHVSDDFAYVAGLGSGLFIIDVDPPGSAYLASAVDTTGNPQTVQVSGNYLYLGNGDSGLTIMDIEEPETANIVKSVYTPGVASGAHVSDGYACVADDDAGLQIIDIEPPESAYIVNSINTPSTPIFTREVYSSNGYAFIANGHLPGSSYLEIIDIDPPESGYLVDSFDTPGRAYNIYVSGDYAFVADGPTGLQIINIGHPESAFIEKSIDTPGYAIDVFVADGYAYVVDEGDSLQIIDIDPLESASIVKTIPASHQVYSVYVLDGYAYTSAGGTGFCIFDVTPPDRAHIVCSFDSWTGWVRDVCVSDGYAYVAYYNGLRIIKLW